MTCYHPIPAYQTDSGLIVFGRHQVGKGYKPMFVPCNKCIGCRLDYRSDWTVRMDNESHEHDNSLFITPTYSDEHLPPGQSLKKSDFQNFMKRLRKWSKVPLRFAQSGEYGPDTSRPHHHAIIFGLELPDLQIYKTNDRGEKLYRSEILDQIWGHGYVTIGEVTPQSCGYVASYMLKDISGNYNPKEDYTVLNPETGQQEVRQRPYSTRSNRPGLGITWFDKYWPDVFPDDFVLIQGKKFPPPRYYTEKLASKDWNMYTQIKEKRNDALSDAYNQWNSSKERLKVRETCKKAQIKAHKRGSKVFQEENKIVLDTRFTGFEETTKENQVTSESDQTHTSYWDRRRKTLEHHRETVNNLLHPQRK